MGNSLIQDIINDFRHQSNSVLLVENNDGFLFREDVIKLLEENEIKYKDMVRRLGKPADEKKAGGPIVKKPMGGKVYKNTVSRKHGGAIGVGSALRGFGKGYKKG